MIRFTSLRLDGSAVLGGPVQNLRGGMRSTIQTSMAENVLQEVVTLRQKIATQVEIGGCDEKETSYTPSLPRNWVKAPRSRLSTSASRRDWFRFMQFNMMTDAWCQKNGKTTTPVHGVQVCVPGFTRCAADPDAYYPYNPCIDTEVPPFLLPGFRRAYLVNEICYYDPDIVCLQEVNRSFFNDVMWKYVRYRGYGALYQSSRGYKVRALRKGDDPMAQRHKGKIDESEDIGNVVLFHKGRFVPILMPGKDLVQHLHFAHIVSMRDRVTNMTLNVACTQFTAGESEEAAQTRLHEARQTLKVLDALSRNDTDRAHMSNVVCGDFNNVDDDEACVEFIRERLFSTYDVVGGPRWTTWFHEDPKASAKYERYYACNHAGFECTDASRRAKREAAKYLKGSIGSSSIGGGGKSAVATTLGSRAATTDAAVGAEKSNSIEAMQEEESRRRGEVEEVREDALAMRKQLLKDSGIICRTQDFVFYDPQTLALHQVLDLPEEAHINEKQLLPCSKHPSHHLHLVVDVSFTDMFPDVGENSLRE